MSNYRLLLWITYVLIFMPWLDYMIKIMLGSIPYQKFYFYHLPTRGRVGIKLGDAWYVSNVSTIFDCSMLLYYHSWMFYGHFIVIVYHFFVLTYWHSAKCQLLFFCMLFTSQEINTKRSPNAAKLFGDFLCTRRKMLGPGCTWGESRGGDNLPGHAKRPRHALVGCAHLGGLPNRLFPL